MKPLMVEDAEFPKSAAEKMGYRAPVTVYVKFSGKDEFDAHIKSLNINYITTIIPGWGALTDKDVEWVCERSESAFTKILCAEIDPSLEGIDAVGPIIYCGLLDIMGFFCTRHQSINGGSLFQQAIALKQIQ